MRVMNFGRFSFFLVAIDLSSSCIKGVGSDAANLVENTGGRNSLNGDLNPLFDGDLASCRFENSPLTVVDTSEACQDCVEEKCTEYDQTYYPDARSCAYINACPCSDFSNESTSLSPSTTDSIYDPEIVSNSSASPNPIEVPQPEITEGFLSLSPSPSN